MSPKSLQIDPVKAAILGGDKIAAANLAREALAAGLEPLAALAPFVVAIRQAGDLFEEGEFFLPHLLLASEAMKAALAVIFPESEGEQAAGFARGTVLAGTVQGDIHEIGKNLVCALLSANGFRVIDLGGDVHLDRFLEKAAETKAQHAAPLLLALSALLTTTMIQQQNLIEKLKAAGWREKVKVMVGGAPVTSEWAKRIGADGYAPDAARAVDEALRLIGQNGA